MLGRSPLPEIPRLASVPSIALWTPIPCAFPAAPLPLPTWYPPFPGCSTQAHGKQIPQDTNGDAGGNNCSSHPLFITQIESTKASGRPEEIAENHPVHRPASTAAHSPADRQTDGPCSPALQALLQMWLIIAQPRVTCHPQPKDRDLLPPLSAPARAAG